MNRKMVAPMAPPLGATTMAATEALTSATTGPRVPRGRAGESLDKTPSFAATRAGFCTRRLSWPRLSVTTLKSLRE